MKMINIHDAKTHLSRLAEEVAAGAEIIVAKAGKPVMKLVPLDKPRPRIVGALKGKVHIPPDFDAPLPDDVLDSYEGGNSE